jgi:ATP-dependent DNA ligase
MLTFRYPDKPITTTQDVVRSLNETSYIVNPKYDGWRMLAFIDPANQIRCLSRVGRPMEDTGCKFDPSIKELFKKLELPSGTVLDCEFMGPRGKVDPSICIFDMLAREGSWLSNEPYEQRWARCQELLMPSPSIYLARTVESNFLVLYEQLKCDWEETGNKCYEGIVLKLRKGKLKLSRTSCSDSSAMLKFKYRDNNDRRRY